MTTSNPKFPNIIIFVPDEMRGDLVDNPYLSMPHLDQLRQDGFTFRQNYTVNPVCSPSRCCTFTGQYPQNGGHRSLYQILQPHEENLFRLLKQQGYHVQYIGRNDLFTHEAEANSVSQRQGSFQAILQQRIAQILVDLPVEKKEQAITFMAKNDNPLAIMRHPEFGALFKNMMASPWPEDHRHRKTFYYGQRETDAAKIDPDRYYIDLALQFLDDAPPEPFCLYIGLNFPHPPYTVEEPYFSMYDRDAVPAPIVTDYGDKPHFMTQMHHRYGLDQLSEADFREIVATYYGMVYRVDEQWGQVMDKLKQKNLYDDSAIFYFSDHGDYAGDYGLTEKWPTGFQDSLTRVPLVVKTPHRAQTGQSFDALTQTIDIFPTVLELANIDTPYTHFGQSLLPLINGERTEHREAVFSVGGYNPREPQCFEDIMAGTIYFEKGQIAADDPTTVARATMIRTTEWKLIVRSAGKEELYDLQNDPQECHNLIDIPAYGDIQTQLRNQLLRWYLDTSDNPHWERMRAM
ncbi:MAG: sulfatase-like hydrolase/transferase [Chloroflexota bacterium]